MLSSQGTPTVVTSTPPTILNVTHGTCETADLNVVNTFYSLFMTSVLLFSVGGNAIVMLAVSMSHSLKNRSTFYFVASLACSDLVVAVFTVPFKISFKIHDWNFCHGLSACYLQIVTDMFGNLASILNLLLISVDRFVAIQLPYKYVELLSSRRSKRLIIGAWSIALMWSFVGIYRWEETAVTQRANITSTHDKSIWTQHNSTRYNSIPGGSSSSSTSRRNVSSSSIYSIHVGRVCQNTNTYFFLASFYAIYIPVLCVMTCVYVKILHVALTQIRKIERNGTSTPKQSTLKTSPIESSQILKNPKRSKWSLRKELRATKSVAIVYLAFCVCWLPSCVISTIIYLDSKYFSRLQKSNESLFIGIFITFIEILPVFSTMVNPIIYSFSNTQFRNAVIYMWRKLIGKTPKKGSYLSSNGRTKVVGSGRASCASSSFLRSTNSLDRIPAHPMSDVEDVDDDNCTYKL